MDFKFSKLTLGGIHHIHSPDFAVQTAWQTGTRQGWLAEDSCAFGIHHFSSTAKEGEELMKVDNVLGGLDERDDLGLRPAPRAPSQKPGAAPKRKPPPFLIEL